MISRLSQPQQLLLQIRELAHRRGVLADSAIIALMVKVGAALIGFFSQIFLAQLLGPEEYGYYSYVWTWILLSGMLLSLGLTEAATRFIAEYRETKAYGYAWGFISNAVYFVVGITFSIALLGTFTATAFHYALDETTYMFILLAFLCIPVFALQDLLEGCALAFSWTGVGQIPTYILRPFLIILFLAVLVFLSYAPTAMTALFAVLAAVITATSIQALFLSRQLKKALPAAEKLTDRILWLKTSLPMLLTNIFHMGLTFTDIIILGFFVDSHLVALYFAVTRISSQVPAFQFAIMSAVAQRMSGLNATKQTDELKKLIRTSVLWIFWPTLAITIFLLIVGWPVLRLFGPEFTEAYPILPILCLGLLVKGMTGGAEEALKMTGFERAEFYAKASATVLNVTLNLLLIPVYGIYGAAIATTVSLIVNSVTLELLVRRYLHTSSFIATLKKA